MKHWQLEVPDDRIARLSFDRQAARVNSLDAESLKELDAALAQCERQAVSGLVIRSAKPSGFIAGADVRALAQVADRAEARSLILRAQAILKRLENLPCPSVAAIHGFCLGGGLELALACAARVVSDAPETRLGFPEIRLGLFPGFGGTARAPPRMGHLPALELMLTGRTLSGRAAYRAGLADDCVPERHLDAAALALLRDPPRRTRPAWWRRMPGWFPLRPLTATWLRRLAAGRANPAHYPAPTALIDHWRRHAGSAEALQRGEAESVPSLLAGTSARNLLRVFLLRERFRLAGNSDGGWHPRHLHVIGAGVMGGDIAAWAVLHGLRVSLQDQDTAPVAAALARAHSLFERRLREPLRVREAVDRLIPDTPGDGVRHADAVVEAIVEQADAKRALFRSLLPRMRPEALLLTNTSSIRLEVLGEGLERPEGLAGLHFFNPVAKMPLVEIVHGPATAETTLQRARTLARMLGKVPVTVRSSPGFLVNRVLMPYLLEAVRLFEEGIPAATIDASATAFGMPMGPLELADTAGLDICLSVAQELSGLLREPMPDSLRQHVADGQLGRKSGQGYHRWPPRGAGRRSGRRRDDLQDRLILRLVNECVACLREGIVASADEIDAGMLFGTGFAPFRGGPLRYVTDTGADRLHARLSALERQFGERFRPDPGWVSLLQGTPR